MAARPVFSPILDGPSLVRTALVSFQWFSGMAVSQRRLSIKSLHSAAAAEGIEPILEVSTRSEDALGQELSAFNLTTPLQRGLDVPVECAFQASKMFERGGPFVDLLRVRPWEAKSDSRLRSSGVLRAFKFEGDEWSLEPKTAFYDWLYLRGLARRPDIWSSLLTYNGFTDIEFNPKKSINCQARSVALFVALHSRQLVASVIADRASFLARLSG